jgi:hypothetical protein
MEIDFRHALPEAEATERLQALGDYLQNRHGIKVDWVDANRATFHGKYMVVKIDGELTRGPGIVRFRGKDPGFLWRKRAADYIEGKLKVYLDPATPIQELPRGKG